jgi:mRNA-degrading endonuclease RelE of RelBE toxin-antitoxin system
VKWYNKIKKGLGKRLKNEIKEVEIHIKLNPTFASIKYKNVRTVACKIFPYRVHYEIDITNNKILITSIFHFSKEPNW